MFERGGGRDGSRSGRGISASVTQIDPNYKEYITEFDEADHKQLHREGYSDWWKNVIYHFCHLSLQNPPPIIESKPATGDHAVIRSSVALVQAFASIIPVLR